MRELQLLPTSRYRCDRIIRGKIEIGKYRCTSMAESTTPYTSPPSFFQLTTAACHLRPLQGFNSTWNPVTRSDFTSLVLPELTKSATMIPFTVPTKLISTPVHTRASYSAARSQISHRYCRMIRREFLVRAARAHQGSIR